ncbi:PRC-barrel domain-containing protein [Paraburkholderia phenazinium]|uniref:PRC-barrel domain-containing protein n=1 Tax=Paraburkholderia phenazinium TaxID=60549 RepID=A0A1N6KIN9_9BURK|nr:PRC-barrel domain-containing protein [Paraburkholderia phenazinium]SIO56425.1 PRC-barrel domain-containing protein [Paraburkholderia phenazinium]
MSGGFPRPAFRYPILLVLAAMALSGCSLLRGPQQAPITEAVPVLVSPDGSTLVAGPPETTVQTEAAKPEAPPKPKRPVAPPRKPEEPPAPPVAAPTPPPAPAPLIVTRLIDRNQAHGLLDSEVQKPDGKVVGRAVDLVTDASGKPIEMVVNLQGFLGVGDRKVNFPWNVFRFTPNAKAATITLNLAPGQAPPADRSKAAAAAAGVATATRLPLLDATVERPNGGKVGRVVDVLIDGNAQPQAVVLDVSGMVSADRRTIAANWSALHFGTKDKALYPLMDLSDAAIAASPAYDAGQPIRAVSPAPPPAPAPAPAPAAPSSSTAAASTARASR